MSDLLEPLERRPEAAAGESAPRARPGVRRARLHPAYQVLVIGAIALVGASLLNVDSLWAMAKRQPFGTRRDAELALLSPVRSFSHVLGLELPARLIHNIRHRAGGPGRHLVAAEAPPVTTEPPTTVAEVAPTAAPMVPPTPISETTTTEAPPPVTTAPSTSSSGPAPLLLRRPSPGHPLHLWVGGDSLAVGLGDSLANLSGNQSFVSTSADGHISTGLTRPDYFDWPAEVTRVLTGNHPDVMVLMFGANDPQPIAVAGHVYQIDAPQWQAEYQARVARIMATVAPSERLIWVGLPAMRSAELDRKMQILNSIYAVEAVRHPGVVFLDARALFGPVYSAYSAGGTVKLRAGDGIHFTAAGYTRLGQAVLDEIHREIDSVPSSTTTTSPPIASTTSVATTVAPTTTATAPPTSTTASTVPPSSAPPDSSTTVAPTTTIPASTTPTTAAH